MIEQYLGITSEQMIIAAGQTVYMLFWGLVLGSLLGIPLGILLTITRKGGILQNKAVYTLINYTINIVRSVPYIILLVAIMPLTKIIVGTRIGTQAALVSLVFYITPFLSRLVESSLLEVDKASSKRRKHGGDSFAGYLVLFAAGSIGFADLVPDHRHHRSPWCNRHGGSHRRRRCW